MDCSSDSLLASICWMAGISFFGGGGQGDAAFGAGEQRKAALGLHAGHRVADGGRGDVHTLRRGGKKVPSWATMLNSWQSVRVMVCISYGE